MNIMLLQLYSSGSILPIGTCPRKIYHTVGRAFPRYMQFKISLSDGSITWAVSRDTVVLVRPSHRFSERIVLQKGAYRHLLSLRRIIFDTSRLYAVFIKKREKQPKGQHFQ